MLIDDGTFRRLCRARDRLGDCIERPSIHDVAREARISPYHFIRQFHAVFGATPHQFRTARKLDRAKLLLARGEHSVTEVCMEVGFASLGSFTDLFTRRIGVPPSVYRRRVHPLVGLPIHRPGCLALMAQAFRNFREAVPPRSS